MEQKKVREPMDEEMREILNGIKMKGLRNLYKFLEEILPEILKVIGYVNKKEKRRGKQ